MALKTVYTSADEVPEAHREFYAESADGRFVLDLEDIDSHPKVRGVITANRENATKAKDRQTRIEELESRINGIPEDFDAGEWERLKSGAKPDEQINALRDQHSRMLDSVKAKHATDLAALNQQLSERDGYIDNQTRSAALASALDEVGFDQSHKPMLTKWLADQIKVRQEDGGKRVAYAETDMGDLSTLDYVREFASKQGKAYLSKASGPSGVGSSNSRIGGKTITRSEFSKLDPASQAKAMADKVQLVD